MAYTIVENEISVDLVEQRFGAKPPKKGLANVFKRRGAVEVDEDDFTRHRLLTSAQNFGPGFFSRPHRTD